ncbi:MAG: hypothetical protein P4L49_02725 [Desulfosporosinus sp.]|nr:hypothetical protein [Desulfosporosinus sp.]
MRKVEQMKIDSGGVKTAEQINKKCGNCGHLLPLGKFEKELGFLKELPNGKCELTGKHMIGALIAGCFYWCDRNTERGK